MLDVGLRWYVSQSVASYSDPCVVLHAYDPPVFDGHARREQCSGPFYDPSLRAGQYSQADAGLPYNARSRNPKSQMTRPGIAKRCPIDCLVCLGSRVDSRRRKICTELVKTVSMPFKIANGTYLCPIRLALKSKTRAIAARNQFLMRSIMDHAHVE